MRLAVLSDIHGNLPALEAVSAELAAESVDAVFNLGDIASGPLWPRETVDALMHRPWLTLAGNHERQLLGPAAAAAASDRFAAWRLDAAHKAWLAALPGQLQHGEVAAVHGSPGSDHEPLLDTVTPDLGHLGSAGVRAATPAEVQSRLRPAPAAGCTLLLCGHTHQPRLLQLPGLLVLNPGSVGLPAYDHDQPHPHRVETGSPHARWALAERTPAGWRVQLRLTPYDWEAAAAKAEREGRGDWADALRSGRVGRTEASLSLSGAVRA